MQMLQSDWLSDRTLSAISSCAVAGGRLQNGGLLFVFPKFWRDMLMQMAN